MTTTTSHPVYHEFRLFYNTEDLFQCFAKNIGDAIGQLNEFVGESFTVNQITEIKQGTERGWITVK